MKYYMEIRAGIGGKDAEIFTEEIMSAYIKFANSNDIEVELLDNGKTKLLTFSSKTKAIKTLLNESGVHKTQRIPETETKGRIQTSTVTVVVYEHNETKESDIPEKELLWEAYKAPGPGGQHKNTTMSAVRLTHIPSGIVVCCGNERSQFSNKKIALDILNAKLLKMQKDNARKQLNDIRSSKIKNGERSEAKRLYNFSRDEVFDYDTNKRSNIKDILKKGKFDNLV